ncbi:MAG: S8/S53 family peptidase [Novosphingobium sp.]|nr:S8/S53 family peptidase [Novosphingobium sp.]
MPTVAIFVEDPSLVPYDVVVTTVTKNGEESSDYLGRNWTVEIDFEKLEVLRVIARNHWSFEINQTNFHSVASSRSILLKQITRTQWEKFGLKSKELLKKDNAIRIGVADCGFAHGFDGLNIYDANANIVPRDQFPDFSHGSRVMRVIDGKSNKSHIGGGILKNVEIDFIDIGHMINGIETWDPTKLSAAVQLFIDVFDVNLINLSGGIIPNLRLTDIPDLHPYSAMKDSVEEAFENGVVCICAIGNSHKLRSFYPASDAATIGVGAAGRMGISPFPNLGSLYEVRAAQHGLTSCGDADCADFYASPENSRGSGLDCLAPGVALPICVDDGAVFDYTGSSFATPIVTAALAAALDGDETYWMKAGFARAEYVKKKLASLCQDMGLSVDVQGHGLILISG